MLHHHGGAESPPYMAPTTAGTGTAPFSPTRTGPAVSVAADIPPAAPPTTMPLQPTGPPSANFEELPAGGSDYGAGAGAGAAASIIQDEDMQPNFGGASGGAGASGSGGHHRWPREETLALIRIRTEMDADFRNAPLKAPLWEDVARKLAGLGYHRSAKKCKEKFENVDKYYKRTKDARAGRQDGKSYRFFSQLEALHAAAPQPQTQLPPPLLPGMTMTTVQAGPHQPMAIAWATAGPTPMGPPPAGAGLPDLSFSSMSGSESASDSDSYSDDYDDSDDAAGEEGLGTGRGGECDREMMAIFEGMMKQVTEKQDAMQRVFLATLERWEAERTAREEAWRRQEVARMNREREQLARERAAAASRDAALIAFLQRVGGGGQQGQPVRLPPHSAGVVPAPPVPAHTSPSARHDAAATSSLQQLVLPAPLTAVEALAWAGAGEGGGSTSSSSSRWPKEEVEALIQMRNEKDAQYHDAGAKGPLWEDIAAGMRRIGYNRSAKRCKEKWENINKYYKKVKESNKRRPEDSKTCPYFHQLDAMYRKKHRAGGGSRGSSRTAPGANMDNAVTVAAVAVAAPVQDNPSQRELEGKSSNDVDSRKNGEQGNVQASPGNGDTAPTTTPPPGDGATNKTAEDNVNETNVQHQQQQFSADETDSDDDITTVYTEEGNDEDKVKYKMGVQKPDVIGSSGEVPAPPPPPPPPAAEATAAAPTSSAAPSSGTFLAVQ